MSYGEPKPQHRNAVQAVSEARQRALSAVSEARKADASPHHPNLAPASDEKPELAVVCTQEVVNYLIQLRPYRASSRSWHIDFGTVELPTEIKGGKSMKLGDTSNKPSIWLCRDPVVPLRGVTELIDAANMTVQYSTNRPPEALPGASSSDGVGTVTRRDRRMMPEQLSSGTKLKSVSYKLNSDEYGDLLFDDREARQAVANGAMTEREAVEMGAARAPGQEEEEEESGYIPAIPSVRDSTPGRASNYAQRVKTFKFVFPPATLLKIVEIADEVAAEMDLLAEIEAPDHDATGDGAV